MSELVSIVIPTYNREKYIAEALDSALSQTYTNIEIVVSDNASTDSTADIVRQYAHRDGRIKFFQNEQNIGPVLNWKVCLDHATGDFIKILWSDDTISPDFIEKTIFLFKCHGKLAFVFTKANIGSDKNNIISTLYSCFNSTGVYPARDFVQGIIGKMELPYSPGCALFRTDILRCSFVVENNLFENRYLVNGAGPDLLMYLVATTQADSFGYVAESLSFFRAHDNSITVSSNSRQLGLDYGKAIIWFLYHYIGVDDAMIYWIYIFKKMKVYKSKDEFISFSIYKTGINRLRFKHLMYVFQCFVVRSKYFLSKIRIKG